MADHRSDSTWWWNIYVNLHYCERKSLIPSRKVSKCTSQWPRGLRRGSATAPLLWRRNGIPPEHGCLFAVNVVCCQVEVSASDWSLVQRSPTECGVSECDREALIMSKTWPTRAVEPWIKKRINKCNVYWWILTLLLEGGTHSGGLGSKILLRDLTGS